MLLAQLVDFLRQYDGADHSVRAREAVLEWALCAETPANLASAAQEALVHLPAAASSPALREFRDHLRVAALGLPEPRRRGGSAGRRAALMKAA